jgi:hypothetical protein
VSSPAFGTPFDVQLIEVSRNPKQSLAFAEPTSSVVPMLQRTHPVDPLSDAKVPAGHREQAAEGEEENVPGEHREQAEADPAGAKLPGGHSSHPVLPFALRDLKPAPHSRQLGLPSSAAYRPAPHSMQDVDPVPGAAVPGAQREHGTPDVCWNRPPRHGSHDDPSADGYEPRLQLIQIEPVSSGTCV